MSINSTLEVYYSNSKNCFCRPIYSTLLEVCISILLLSVTIYTTNRGVRAKADPVGTQEETASNISNTIQKSVILLYY